MPAYLTESLITAAACTIFFGISWYAYRRQRNSWALAGILLGGLALRLFAGADQYLHEWDEKYHALVAKNLIGHLLKPTLFENPVLPYNYEAWCCNHVWLSKPPFPLWLMAGSIHLFGATDWAVRVPSLLLSLFAIGLTYRMGKQLFDTPTALFAAFLHAVNGKLIELAAGRDSSDHVETCHVVLFQLAVWFILKNWQQKDRVSALWAGLFTGLAFLSKWTPAFFLPMIWFTGMLWQKRPARQVISQAMIIGFFAAAVSLPWVWFMAKNYPAESGWLWRIMTSNSRVVIENHAGPWYFYLDRARILFGELVYIPLLAGLFVLYRRRGWTRLSGLALWIGIPLLFLSAAATKRDTYLLVAAPAFFLLTAWAVRVLLLARHWRPARRWWYTGLAALFLLLPLRYGIERTKLFVSRERRPEWVERIARYRQEMPGSAEQNLLFGFDHNIEMMYYTGITTYPYTPDASEMDRLKQAGYRVYLLQGAELREY